MLATNGKYLKDNAATVEKMVTAVREGWRAIGELYRYSEAGGFATTPLTIYPGLHGTGTVEQEYLKVMMLWASSADVPWRGHQT